MAVAHVDDIMIAYRPDDVLGSVCHQQLKDFSITADLKAYAYGLEEISIPAHLQRTPDAALSSCEMTSLRAALGSLRGHHLF